MISDSVEEMNALLKTAHNFCEFAGGMKINASKCATLAYIYEGGRRFTVDTDFKINGEVIPTY